MEIYDIAENFATNTTRSIFLTGKAGTGKTTFLKKLKESCHKQLAIVAPTGVAAINAGGVTIHSFFQLPFTPFVPTPEGRRNLIGKLKMSGVKRKVIQELELLIIDEISMVRADIMDEIDLVLRHFRFRHNEPFGGVQLICIGDLYQLAPVAIHEEWQVLAPYYRTPYFFDSQVIQHHPLLYLEFDKVFRQKDATFIRILNEVRNDQLSSDSLALLQQQSDPAFDINQHQDYILLTTHNAKADRINDTEMGRLRTKEYTFTAQITGDFPEKSLPNHQVLALKVGAKVMFIANDTETPRRYFNGKIGTISNIDADKKIWVHCDGDKEDILVKSETWENIRYTVNPTTKQIEEKKLGTYTQYPLRLAWAITIHKSQGLTFDKVAVDIESAFTAGQVYVALSRCRSLDGIVLLSNIQRNAISVDPNVTLYASQKTTNETLERTLSSAKAQFNKEILLSIFNFSFSAGLSSQIYDIILKDAPLFSNDALQKLLPIKAALQELTNIGGRFCQQIQRLCQNDDYSTLTQRIQSASDYFTKELDAILNNIEDIKISTQDKELANEYKLSLESLHDDIAQKSYIISNIKKDYSAKNYFKLKDHFKAKKFKVDCKPNKKDEKENTKNKKKKSSDSKQSTYEITLELYKKGLSLEQIAEVRDLALSSIERHIAHLIFDKAIPMSDFLTKEQEATIFECFEAGATISDIYDTLEGNVSYQLLRRMYERYAAKNK